MVRLPHFGKSCALLDAAALPGLLAEADACIDSRPPAARIGCDPRVLAPGLLHLDVSWFGRSGPYAGFAGGDAVYRALAGLVQLVGPAAGPPLAHPDHQAAIIAGLSGAIAVLGCLLGQQDGEAGRAVELSVHEACIALAEYQASEARIAGWPDARLGVNRFTPTFRSASTRPGMAGSGSRSSPRRNGGGSACCWGWTPGRTRRT